jgi:hypothetical protein
MRRMNVRIAVQIGSSRLPHTAEEQAITMFLVGLRGASEALKGRSFKLSLEVNYEEEAGSWCSLNPLTLLSQRRHGNLLR